jgi:CheY-like chemotaxis protein
MAANPAVASMLGYTREEIVGLDARVLFPSPADIRRFQETMAAEGVVRDLEVQLRHRNGTMIPARLSATRRYGADGAIQGHQCLLRRGEALPAASAAQGTSVSAPVGAPVLAVDTGDAARAEIVKLLAWAGVPVFEAGSLARAIELLREHAGTLAAVILGVEAGERGVDLTVEEFRRIDPEVPIIVSSNEDRFILAEQLADLEIAAFVDRPPHPLALVQRVRELAALRVSG